MPDLPKRACSVPGCPDLESPGGHGRCRSHARMRELTYRDPKVRALYRTARWLKLRGIALAGHPICAACARAGRITAATDVHHVRRHGGDPALFFDFSNLECLCVSCHASETAREVWGS